MYLAAYDAVRSRITGLIAGLIGDNDGDNDGANDGDAPVPACPGWRVHDVLAHLAGVCEDWVHHRLDGYASVAWTADQVARFARHSSAGTPALHLSTPDTHDWWLGTARSPGAVSCEAPAYEIFRALAGRRTAEQVRAWNWSGDPEAFLQAGLPAPFRWAEEPLSD